MSEADAAGADTIDRRAIPPAARESRWRARDGHELRRIDWPGDGASPRGSILFFPGRGDAYEKYLETLEEWHRDGWRVTSADWRGQAGSGRLGGDEHTGHIDDFSTWTGDLAHLWEQWVEETPAPHVIAGHSMGGHLVMRALVDRLIAPDAAVLVAPMLELQGPPLPLALTHCAAALMARIGDPMRQAWKWSEKPGEFPVERANLLTRDPDRYADEQWWREQRPELVMGPASWRWVERACASCRLLAAPGVLEQVAVPVLIVSTSGDRLVSHAANVRAAARLPHGRLYEFGDEALHEILREADPVRRRALEAIAAFLDETTPPR